MLGRGYPQTTQCVIVRLVLGWGYCVVIAGIDGCLGPVAAKHMYPDKTLHCFPEESTEGKEGRKGAIQSNPIKANVSITTIPWFPIAFLYPIHSGAKEGYHRAVGGGGERAPPFHDAARSPASQPLSSATYLSSVTVVSQSVSQALAHSPKQRRRRQ